MRVRHFAAAMLLLGLTSATARADDQEPSWWIAPGVHLTAVSALVQGDALGLSAGVSVSAGRRWNDTSLVLQLENTWWGEALLDTEGEDVFKGVAQGTLALGIGLEYVFADGMMRFMLTGGPTVLLRNTLLDTAGTIGVWGEVRPAGVRVALPTPRRSLVIDPLSFALLLPDFSGIPLVLFQFRTTVSVEFDGLGAG